MTEKLTIAEVEAMAAKYGITLEPEDYQAAHALSEQRRVQVEQQLAQAEQSKHGAGAWADRFNRALPRVLKAIMGIGNASTVVLFEFLVGPGMLIVLSLLLLVEQQRVSYGIALFEIHGALAVFASIVLVFLNIMLEVQIARVENRHQWVQPTKHQFSLRIWWLRLNYIFGRQTAWQPLPKSPALRFRVALRIVTFTILALALAGSMTAVIQRAQGNWIVAIQLVLLESTLIEMITWLGGLLFALSAVLGAQVLAEYAAQTAIQIAEAISSSAPDNRMSAALEAAGMTAAAALLARLKEKQTAIRRAAAQPAELPSLENVIRVSAVSKHIETPDSLPPATKNAIQWLQSHPEAETLSIRGAAAASGLSGASIQRARAALRERV